MRNPGITMGLALPNLPDGQPALSQEEIEAIEDLRELQKTPEQKEAERFTKRKKPEGPQVYLHISAELEDDTTMSEYRRCIDAMMEVWKATYPVMQAYNDRNETEGGAAA